MNNQITPLISIIVAVFNGAKTLQQCIDSVTQQTYSNKELIIIDGGSQDGTVDLLDANSAKISYWVSEQDRGIYSAWNKGLAQAKGEWICFLGADDYFWDLSVLDRISNQLVKLPASISVAYGQVIIVNDCGQELYRMGEPWQKVKNSFKQVMSIPHVGTMHRYSLFELHGKFDESFLIAGDYELLMRELKTNDAYFIQDVMVAAMRIDGVSQFAANSLLVVREKRRALEMHSQHLSGWFWLIAMAKAFIKLMVFGMFGKRFARKALDFYWRIMGLPPFCIRTRNYR
jgi:glycosyltransferase involved in cell wall biosynthesis